ncbi:helix-turn-helix domain-containing protein [Streptomyces sp. NRRL F-2580]|uniref:helix-turn-helix domain-containing protein n=1 Tax=Streptomyces sp. NRRL F-2580 TaxID=1463841 RepID=UPI00099C7308|nr:Scr1 family TA system antitoxin-like transcriptional regulator [Streptomyces sp. NRRL F-2580]
MGTAPRGRPRLDLDTSTPAGLLGSKVRRMRDARGWTPKQLADEVFSNESLIRKLERGQASPSEGLVAKLDKVFDAGDELNELWPLLAIKTVTEYAEGFLDHQKRAKKIQEYSQVVPGLFQTHDYAFALAESMSFVNGRDPVAVAESRVERQAILTGPSAPWFLAVLDEAAIRRVVGSKSVMVEQLEHLIKLSERPRIEVHVLSFGETVPAVLTGSLSVLTMRSGTTVAYTEGPSTGRMFQGSEADSYAVLYDRVLSSALPKTRSIELIRAVIEEYRK